MSANVEQVLCTRLSETKSLVTDTIILFLAAGFKLLFLDLTVKIGKYFEAMQHNDKKKTPNPAAVRLLGDNEKDFLRLIFCYFVASKIVTWHIRTDIHIR
jgi:hypothetical protein